MYLCYAKNSDISLKARD